MKQSLTRTTLAREIIRGMLTGLVLTVAFFAGFVVRDRVPAVAQPQEQETLFPLLAQVQNLVSSNYLRDVPPDRQMEYAAIRGYLSGLDDQYTFFIDPPVAQNESDVLAGTYGGIGVQVQRNEQGLFVIYPFRDSPAAAAGIQDGDILIGINGTDLPSMERLDVIDQMLRGEVGEGRGVSLTVQHPDEETFQDYFIEFAVVNVPSVVWRVLAEDSELGYVQILRFTNRTPDELQMALTDLKSQNILALVIDLRGNPGGLLQESVEVASEFISEGVVFYERRRDGETTTNVIPGGLATELPLVVLVDSGTASAAEVVAGAIRDSNRGILIGQKTYGKGSVQLIFRLVDDSSIHITSAEWFTPARAPLDGVGLEPDISMIPAEDDRDVELGEAIRYLQQQKDN